MPLPISRHAPWNPLLRLRQRRAERFPYFLQISLHRFRLCRNVFIYCFRRFPAVMALLLPLKGTPALWTRPHLYPSCLIPVPWLSPGPGPPVASLSGMSMAPAPSPNGTVNRNSRLPEQENPNSAAAVSSLGSNMVHTSLTYLSVPVHSHVRSPSCSRRKTIPSRVVSEIRQVSFSFRESHTRGTTGYSSCSVVKISTFSSLMLSRQILPKISSPPSAVKQAPARLGHKAPGDGYPAFFWQKATPHLM